MSTSFLQPSRQIWSRLIFTEPSPRCIICLKHCFNLANIPLFDFRSEFLIEDVEFEAYSIKKQPKSRKHLKGFHPNIIMTADIQGVSQSCDDKTLTFKMKTNHFFYHLNSCCEHKHYINYNSNLKILKILYLFKRNIIVCGFNGYISCSFSLLRHKHYIGLFDLNWEWS